MPSKRIPARLIAAAVIVAGLLIAPSLTDAAGTTAVKLSDYKIAPATKTTSAGKVTFTVHNGGHVTHELSVLKTSRDAGALKRSKARAVENGKIGEAEGIRAGKNTTLSLTLKPGHYVLICNVADHYSRGMHINFTVR